MIFYKLGNILLLIFALVLLFGSSLHIFIWTPFFSNHGTFALLMIVVNALLVWIIVKNINHYIRENTLKNIINDMNSHMNPEMVFLKYKLCIVDWKQIQTPVRILYRFILNHPLKIWNYHLAEEIGFDQLSKKWKLIGESENWQIYTGPEVPDEVPIGECRKCNHQIYKDDLEELDDKEMGLVCTECGSTELDFGNE
jgi:hypothetical protein